MLERTLARCPARVLDVGCGEGRFCRMLRERGSTVVGIDPTPPLLEEARRRDPAGSYVRAMAEGMPFADGSFDVVVSYLTLIDIADWRAAIQEMTRVLAPRGALLVANLTSFVTPCADVGWVYDEQGRKLHYPVDGYLEERGVWLAYKGIRVVNYHRPLSAYMSALLAAGLKLTYFDEPAPVAGAPEESAESYRRVPWLMTMEWEKG